MKLYTWWRKWEDGGCECLGAWDELTVEESPQEYADWVRKRKQRIPQSATEIRGLIVNIPDDVVEGLWRLPECDAEEKKEDGEPSM